MALTEAIHDMRDLVTAWASTQDNPGRASLDIAALIIADNISRGVLSAPFYIDETVDELLCLEHSRAKRRLI